ncbi:hypothetical protein Goklo_025192, partial [Gossypium klotzschianum]|nr:hypothetical protein [Gossypium klotzschianum]
MATNSMEANFKEIPNEGEGNTKYLKECASDNFFEELDIEGPKMDVSDENHVSNKSDLEVAMRWNQGLLNCLEEALDELHFHNNSYKKGSTSPNFHVTLQHRVLHGNNINLATERELLKEMSTTRNQLPVDYDINHDSTHFKQSLNEFIQLFYEERQSEREDMNPWASLATIKKYITIIKELSEEIETENIEIISEIEEAKMNKETESIRKKLLKLEHQLRDMRPKREEDNYHHRPKNPNGLGLDFIELADRAYSPAKLHVHET